MGGTRTRWDGEVTRAQRDGVGGERDGRDDDYGLDLDLDSNSDDFGLDATTRKRVVAG